MKSLLKAAFVGVTLGSCLLISASVYIFSGGEEQLSRNEEASESVAVPRQGNSPESATLVISQIYGGGGSIGAPYQNDFIELFNPQAIAVVMTDWSVQYASATGTNWQRTVFSGTIPPGGYFLVQEASSGSNGVPLPSPDAVGSINLSATAGKVALVTNSTFLTGSCPLGGVVIDFVGFGSTANCFEGSGPTANLSLSTAAARNGNGCVDTDNNSADFSVVTPLARNSASTPNLCLVATATPTQVTPTSTSVQSTVTPVPSTSASTVVASATNTSQPPSATSTATTTLFPATPTSTQAIPTNTTSVPPTDTPVVPSATATSTNISSISSNTPTQTQTATQQPPGTSTSLTTNTATTPPPSTPTVAAPTSTATLTVGATNTPGPTGGSLVISQVYGGGGSAAGTTFCFDFIELFNPTQAAITADSWSVQYGAASNNLSSIINLPDVTIPSGGYYLIQTGSATTGTCAPLPTPDLVSIVNLAATSGKVALVNNQALLACGASGNRCTANPNFSPFILDFVGYGAATDYEGGGPVPTLGNTSSGERNGQGCVDTDNNQSDFTVITGGAITPRNSQSPPNICAGATPSATSSPVTATNTPVPMTASATRTTTAVSTAPSTATSVAASATTTRTRTSTPTVLTATSTSQASSTPIATATNTPGIGGSGLRISQVYGGGGSPAASTFCFDFIELFNPTSAPVTTINWSVQYGSASNNLSGIIALPNVTIPAGGYYLIQTGSATTGTCAPLPPPDLISTLNIAATGGKIALVSSQTLLACGAIGNRCTTNPGFSPFIVDFVGYGAASDYEGSGPVGALSSTTSAERNEQGCIDTDHNLADFTIIAGGAITPRNSASPPNLCAGGAGTPTSTIPPSLTATRTPGLLTNTPTQTRTSTPMQTATSTSIPAASHTGTSTALVSATDTVVQPTITAILISTPAITVIVPSATGTAASISPVPTSTGTSVSATATATNSPTAVATIAATTTATATTATPQTTAVTTSTPCPITFTDVDTENPFYAFIRCLSCRGIISGYSDGTFKPNNDISRGQIAKMVSNSAGFGEDPGTQVYEDVPSESPFYSWINRLSMRGHMGGYICGIVPEEPCLDPERRPYFRPSASATRGQISKIVSNAAGVGGTPSGIFYTDVQEDNPFYVWVMRLTTLNVMGGYPCGGETEPCDESNRPYFRPFSTVTRGQASKIVANTFLPGCKTPLR